MKVGICVKCHRSASAHRTLEKVIDLMTRGAWLCPNFAPGCGDVDGRTQDQIRDDVFKKACLEILADMDHKGETIQ